MQKQELGKIVGPKNVIDDPLTLEAYSKDYSFVPPRRPSLVVKPKNVDEVQRIVKWANETKTPLVPISSGPPHFRGDTVPSAGGAVIVDLSGMKRIINISSRNRMVIVEPGVTFGELQSALEKEGLRIPMPLLPRSSKSVVASFLEREPISTPRNHWALTDPLRCLELVWGNGEIFRTGQAWAGTLEQQWKMYNYQINPWGPYQVDYYRFVSAAQGSMAIVTWASLRCEILPQIEKFFFVPSKNLGDLLDLAYKLLKFRFADELLFLNSWNLASILGRDADQIKELNMESPSWVLMFGIAGRREMPVERVEYQRKDIEEMAQQYGLQLLSAIPGATGDEMLRIIRNPSEEPYWKLKYEGGCQDIFFMTTLNRTPDFVKTMYSVAETIGYPTSEIGIYIQPTHQGASCHCEFNLPYNPKDMKQADKVRELLSKGSEALMSQGAFFSRPYDIWADMVYNRNTQSTILLRKVKGLFDPSNVMNPGKLCF